MFHTLPQSLKKYKILKRKFSRIYNYSHVMKNLRVLKNSRYILNRYRFVIGQFAKSKPKIYLSKNQETQKKSNVEEKKSTEYHTSLREYFISVSGPVGIIVS